MPLSISSRLEDGFGIVSFAGVLTLGPVLRAHGDGVRQFINSSKMIGVILLLSDVTRIDTSGLGELTSIYTTASRRGCALRLVGASPDMLRILKMTRLDLLLPSSPDIETAKAEMRGKAKPATPGL